jgi:hypothetical protein
VVDEVDDVDVLDVVVAPPGRVVVVVAERGRVVPGTVVDEPLGVVDVVEGKVVDGDGTAVVGTEVTDGVVELVVFGALVLGAVGAWTYFEHFPSALHRVMPLELSDFELALGSMLP